MTDYISRDAAIERLEKLFQLQKTTARIIIEAIPSADVRPVVRGEWIDRDDKYYGWNMWECSACGEEFVLTEGTPDMNEYHFCPNCGSDMRESRHETV